MKFPVFMAAAVLAIAPAAPSSLAAQDILVAPQSRAAYVERVGDTLQTQIDRFPFETWNARSGIAQVRFEVGEDGRAQAVRTHRTSGDHALDKAARIIASRLEDLAPLPRGSMAGQTIQANIVLASDRHKRDRLLARLAREEASRIASSPREAAVLVLGAAPPPRS